MRNLIFSLLLFPLLVFAQKREIFRIDSLPKEGTLLNQGWKWHAGDNPEWAKPEFDDASWRDIDPSKEIVKLTHFPTDRPLWLRIKLSHQSAKDYALAISQSGASEIYLNGSLIQKIGQIDPSNHHTIAYNPLDDHLILKLDSLDNTLAIRYYFQQGLNLDPIYNIRYPLFLARIFDSKYMLASPNSNFWPGFNIGFAFILFFIHGVLFLYYPPLRANLWFSVYAFTNTLFSYLHFQLEINPYLERNTQYINFLSLMSLLGPICICYCIYLLLENKRKIYVYLFVVSNFTNVLSYYFFDFETRDILVLVSGLFQALLLVAMALDANRVGDRRGMPVLYGTLAYVAFWSLFSISFPLSWSQTSKDILFHLATLSFPVTISALLGFKFRQVNQSLLHNLEQVNQLYVEKQQILANQNETLELQVTERTTELSSKNRELEIEAALERVRSRTMDMQKSEELQKVTFVLYEQLKYLGFNFGASSITFMDARTGDMDWWMEGFGDGYQFLEKYHVKYFDHPSHIEQLAHWRKGTPYAVISVVGEEKKSFDKFYFNETDFIRVPEKTKELMMQHEAVDFSMAYMQYGALSWSPTTLSDEQAKILQRFAKVFEQTYTRFLDLQKAEAQAELAKLNLIQIQTEKKKAEDTLVELRATQAQLIQSEKLASLGELTAGIAHEIQNPLNFVNNFAEVSAEMLDEMHEELEKGDTTEAIAIATDLKTNLEKINHHGQRASSIVKGMLEHSRASTGVKEPTDLNALADEFLRLAYHGLRAKDNNFNATMETHFDPDLPLVSVIPQDIGRVLLNLINNAFYAVAEKAKQGIEGYDPTVTISTRRLCVAEAENAIVIIVKDNGNGIPEAIKDKIFQPFFTTKPTGQGTGLGLSLAYDIVTKGHGGTFEVVSTENEGSEFIIRLPLLSSS